MRESPPEVWWVVESPDLGTTAMPSRELAHQGAEVIRGLRYRVALVRAADMTNMGDLMAIKQSREEINSARMDQAMRAGAINARNQGYGAPRGHAT